MSAIAPSPILDPRSNYNRLNPVIVRVNSAISRAPCALYLRLRHLAIGKQAFSSSSSAASYRRVLRSVSGPEPARVEQAAPLILRHIDPRPSRLGLEAAVQSRRLLVRTRFLSHLYEPMVFPPRLSLPSSRRCAKLVAAESRTYMCINSGESNVQDLQCEASPTKPVLNISNASRCHLPFLAARVPFWNMLSHQLARLDILTSLSPRPLAPTTFSSSTRPSIQPECPAGGYTSPLPSSPSTV